jgi:hypothetical protein
MKYPSQEFRHRKPLGVAGGSAIYPSIRKANRDPRGGNTGKRLRDSQSY